ncbi:MAG: VWA domain-containing protein [Planctomycetes bacterium]|nr:VWA domain-containing protein [Planctomycetota bacterium]
MKVLLGIVVAALAVLGLVGGCAMERSGSAAGAVFEEPRESAPPIAERDAYRGDAEADELWILPRDTSAAPQRSAEDSRRLAAQMDGLAQDELPGCGGLVACEPASRRHVVLPLEHTDVVAEVTGALGDVVVTQRFGNPYASKIEAVYVFPLPENGAVRDFTLTVGQRVIRGIVREREEAERIYAAAKRAGKVAALLTEERPNVFTQRVANLEPGKRVDVTLRYLHGLRWVDGAFEFVFPMVVGPRYDPRGTPNGISAVTAATLGSSGAPHEVPYLRADERSGRDVSITVRVMSGLPLERVDSPTHAIRRGQQQPTDMAFATYVLDERDRIPNKDFVLRLPPAGNGPRAGLVVGGRGRERFFQLTLVPPADLASIPRAPIELVFVVDASGSMQGAPLETVKRALHAALGELREGDAFQLVRFSNEAVVAGRRPIEADARGVAAGHAWIERLQADGGTEVMSGVRAAFGLERDPERERVVCFLTDGFVSNEDEILRAIHAERGDARVFSFGVGSAPNRFLLEELATAGDGAAAWLRDDGDTARTMRRFLERVSHPALADVQLDFGRLAVRDVYPARVPDLLLGRAVIVTGRIEDADGLDGAGITVRGRAGGARREFAAPVRVLESGAQKDALPWLWARARIAEFASRARLASSADERRACATEIKRTALEHGLLSAFTAFIAVDSLSRTAGDHGVTVPVSVPIPAGVRYETVGG